MPSYRVIGLGFKLVMGVLLASIPVTANPIDVQFVGVGGEHQNGYYTYP